MLSRKLLSCRHIPPLAVLIAALLFTRGVLAGDYPPLTLPAGEYRDLSGKVIAPSDLATAPAAGINRLGAPTLVSLSGIKPGAYRVGLVVDTGATLGAPYGLATQYYIAVQRGGAAGAERVCGTDIPADPNLKPVRKPEDADKPQAFYRGLVMGDNSVWLTPDAKVGGGYTGGDSSEIQAVYLIPDNTPADGIHVSLKIDAPDNAFIPTDPPKVHVEVANALNQPWNGFIRYSTLDLLTDKTAVEFAPVALPALSTNAMEYTPALANGVFRLDVSAADGKLDNQVGSGTARTFMAYSPAKLARDLPDDWPMATHGQSTILHALMPGFKWYRCFLGWGDLEPARGVFNWSELDATLDKINKAGGKMLLAGEGGPGWINDQHNGRRGPDNFDDYRDFIRALVDHCDGKLPLGAIEVYNEPNANTRWQGTPQGLVELTKITYEETRRTQGRIKTVGITISPGHHFDYVESLTDLGILNYVDVVGGHFYEEPGSFDRLDLRNNFPLHIDLLRIPMFRDKLYRPIWDTESGMGYEDSNGRPRPGGRMMTQNEWVAQLKQRKNYNPAEPWQMWASPSEPRMAEEVVTTMVGELANDVEMHFTFHPNWYSLDNTLNLPWVANGCLGEVLGQVDYHYVMPLGINAVGGPDDIGAVAYRIGKPGEKQVVVMWAERVAIKHPFPHGYTPYIDPVPVQLLCAPGTEVSVQDMYLRGETKVKSATYPGGDAVTINVGEEPVFIWNWKSRDQ